MTLSLFATNVFPPWIWHKKLKSFRRCVWLHQSCFSPFKKALAWLGRATCAHSFARKYWFSKSDLHVNWTFSPTPFFPSEQKNVARPETTYIIPLRAKMDYMHIPERRGLSFFSLHRRVCMCVSGNNLLPAKTFEYERKSCYSWIE